jgi:hypothetical protein
MVSEDCWIERLVRPIPSVAFSMVEMPVRTSSRDRLEMSSRIFAVSATRWIEVTI